MQQQAAPESLFALIGGIGVIVILFLLIYFADPGTQSSSASFVEGDVVVIHDPDDAPALNK